jgi:hypothetical protein
MNLKRLGFIAILLSFVLSTNAQVSEIHFGIQASPVWSWLSPDKTGINGNGSLTGFKLGLIIEKRMNENYSFSSGIGFHFNAGGKLLYDLRGNHWKNSAGDAAPKFMVTDTFSGGTELKYNLRYVEIPLGLRLRTNEYGMLRYFAEPFVNVGFKSQANGTIANSQYKSATGGYTANFDQEKLNISSDVTWINMSWGIGFGTEYSLSASNTLIVGLYYQQGFIDVTDDTGSKLYSNDLLVPTVKPDESKAILNALTLRLAVMF